jgi:aerobic carbon-monoxide dehydrogenase small subunit
MKIPVRLTVNGQHHEISIDTRMVLADLLREELDLTGTHVGCGTGSCGACTVMLDGRTVKSCCVLAVDVDGGRVTTIEGLSANHAESLHPVQRAFIENQGLQCGFCTPGMILSAIQLLSENPNPSEEDIRHGIAGNLCRCTGYVMIVDAIAAAGRAMQSSEKEESGRPR